MSRNKTIYIVHEFGIPEHYKGLVKVARKNNYTIRFIEFTCIRWLVKSIIRKDYYRFKKSFKDLIFLCQAFLFNNKLKDESIVLGCAPLDWKLLVLARIFRKSNLIYHSSWHCWDGSFYPKSIFFKKKLESYWKWFLKERVNSFAVVTPQTKQNLIKYFGIEQDNIEIVYHAFETDIFYPLKVKLKVNTRLQVIFIGRLVASKGIGIVIELANKSPEIDFNIIGQGSELENLLEISKELTNINILGFVGDRKKLASLIRESDIIVQPSIRYDKWEELFGMALIEAMACGVVPITSNHAGPKTIIGNSMLSKNLICDGSDSVQMTCDFYEKLKSYQLDRNILELDKKDAIEISQKYEINNIASRWWSIIEGNVP